MEEVIMALQPCFSLSAGVNAANADSKNNTDYTIEDVENRFAALEVEEPTELSGPLEDAHPTTSSASEPIYQLEAPKDKANAEAEKLFALFCLFDDLQNLRKFLMELWSGYGAGRVDLITAAVTTNAAFQLAVRTQEEMLAAYPECGNYQSRTPHIMEMFSASIVGLN
jgi:hypothetical protein